MATKMTQIRLLCTALALTHVAGGCGRAFADTERAAGQLTSEERVFGLAKVWSAVKYSFANFDLVPDLDWDEAFRQYLSRAAKGQTNAEYYRLLKEFVALLHDNHTHVNLPPYLRDMIDIPLSP